MPEAIATSKRKFHKLLDSITAASNTLPSSQQRDKANGANGTTPLTARERMELASERAAKRLRSSTSSTSLSTTLGSSLGRVANSSTTSLPRKMPSAASTTFADRPRDDKQIPNFSPWSQESFLARLKTFSKVSYWHPKPEAIGEVHWAKRGWSCVDLNTVACRGGCERRVVVKLDTIGTVVKKALENDTAADADEAEEEEVDEAELEQALAERYKDEIVEGHTQTCLWRKAACKDDIYRLSLVRPVIWMPQLSDRYTCLLGVSKSIKDITIKSINTADANFLSTERLVAELPTSVLPISNADAALKAKALDIALHGWRGSIEFRADLLHCDTCFQRIGLWMYQPGYKPGKHDTSDDEADEVATVDLVEMHREHCPWRNAASQKATGNFAGLNACQILHRVVSTYAREQRRRSDEQNGVGQDVQLPDSPEVERPKPSREEIARQDKERDSRLRKLKKMFTGKRSSKIEATKASG